MLFMDIPRRLFMKNCEGFTLIEVMVASIVFSVGMLCGLAFFSIGQGATTKAQEIDFALQTAENDMEAAIANPAGLVPGSTITKPAITNTSTNVKFTDTIKVSATVNNYESVQCNVAWTSPGSGVQHLIISSYVQISSYN